MLSALTDNGKIKMLTLRWQPKQRLVRPFLKLQDHYLLYYLELYTHKSRKTQVFKAFLIDK